MSPDRPNSHRGSRESSEESLRVSEIFYSIQGEGRLVGVPSVFVRLSGCNLRCRWCDTPYASWQPDGEAFGIGEIVSQVDAFPARHVVVTGGEPFIFRRLGELTQALSEKGRHLTIETSGTIFEPVSCDLMSLSPKLSSSTPTDARLAEMHEARRLNLDALRLFVEQYDYQLKFVVDAPADVGEIEALLDKLGAGVPPERVFLMPQGRTREELDERTEWIVPICLEKGFAFGPRLHIDLFGSERGR